MAGVDTRSALAGLATAFIGRVADDALGQAYAHEMAADGTDFVNPATVSFGSVEAADVTVVSRTEITATIPEVTEAGGVFITVGTPGGTDTSTDEFFYVEATVISSVTPNKGTVLGGQSITIEGSGFRGVTAVTIDGLDVIDVSVPPADLRNLNTPNDLQELAPHHGVA